MSYTYTDARRRGLTIEPALGTVNTVYVKTDQGVYVPARDLPKIVRELYVGTGKEPPVVLSRYFPQEVMTRDGRVRPEVQPGTEDLDLATARHIASWYATAADLAEAEVASAREREEAAVAQLVDVVNGSTPLSRGDAELIARAVLAAGYTRSES